MNIQVYNFIPKKKKIKVDKMTKKQIGYVTVIEQYKFINGKVPTMREIKNLVGCKSVSSVKVTIDKLLILGYDYKKMRY